MMTMRTMTATALLLAGTTFAGFADAPAVAQGSNDAAAHCAALAGTRNGDVEITAATFYASGRSLPAGPGGPGTFTFSTCWGIPEGSATADVATDFVEFLTSDEQQLAFSDAFGVIPSTESAAAVYADNYPENAAFVAGADYAVTPVAFDGAAAVLGEFNSQVASFAGADFGAILAQFQSQLEAAYAEANG